MSVYECDPAAEVLGEGIIAFLENTPVDRVRPIMRNHGLDRVFIDEWYPLQAWLNVLAELASSGDPAWRFLGIGMMISGSDALLPQVKNMSLSELAAYIDRVYQEQHRGADVGRIWAEQINQHHVAFYAQIVYPDDLILGIICGFVRRWVPRGARYSVEYDSALPTHESGGEYTLIHVTWN